MNVNTTLLLGRLSFLSTLVIWLSACSVVNPETRDSGPKTRVDVSHISNAQPQPVIRTRAGNAPTYDVFGETYTVLAQSRGYRARGVASWYGTKFHGQTTANGEVYDMYGMTAAHKTLPIPSYVRVTHLNNGSSVIVRINDRGPFVDNRLIDLSYVAARKLGIDQQGLAWVEVEDVTPAPLSESTSPAAIVTQNSSADLDPDPDVDNGSHYRQTLVESGLEPGLYLQLGAFQQYSVAVGLQNDVMSMLVAPVNIFMGEDSLHRVKLGPVEDQEKILVWQQILEANGIGSGFIVHR